MLIRPAQEAGMKVPSDANDFEIEKYPHFVVYCAVQLGQSMPSWTSHWSNAKVVAAVPKSKILTVTFNDLVAAGLAVGYPIP